MSTPEEQSERDVITISGQGDQVNYEFSVDGDVEKSEEYGATINSYDTISGSTVTGRTTNEPDSYAYTGTIVSFEADGGIDVSINGNEVNPDTLGEGELGEYESTGEDLDNEFAEVHGRIDALEESGVGDGGSGDEFQEELNALRDRLETLEEAGGGSGGDEQYQEELNEIQDRIAALEGSGGGGEGLLNLENLAAALEPHLEVSGEIPADVEESLSRIDQALEDLSAASVESQSRLDALEEEVASLEGGSGRSDEQIRQLIREYVDEHVDSGMTRDEVESVVTAALEDLDIQGFDQEVIERISHHADALDFPARKVGPSEPIGEYHGVDMWGVKLETGTSCHIHEATVDAAESGSFRAVLGETDGVDQFDLVDSTEIEVEEGEQRVDLDLEVPEAGYYLLAREGDIGLMRGEFGGWDEYMVDNLRLARGDKPGFPENDNWYYFFDMEMTASADHEFPD